jgi:serine-type D-Ala-D-Ala carboxypeptidase (penicillin-binding protein 5/6)
MLSPGPRSWTVDATSMTPSRRILLRACALACAVALISAGPATAAVLDNDTIGGVSVGPAGPLRSSAPDLYIPSGVLSTMDGRVLWARDPDSQRAMASTTKIMTAVVVLENGNLNDVITVDKKAAAVGQSSMGLQVGERISEGELLKGVLVQSGNDAATLIAEHVGGGSVDAFVKMMNDKAAQLDLVNTHYVNVHGLDVANHHTSADDLTALARYAMHNPVFRGIVSTYTVKVRSNLYVHTLVSHNALLKIYPGAEGIKTGWTNNAGYCVVAAAKRGGVELIGTVMGAASEAGRADQAKRLFDWGFAHYRPSTIARQGQRTGNVRVSDYLERTVPSECAETTSLPVFDLAGPLQRRIELQADVAAPVHRGEVIGTMTVYQGSTMLAQLPLTATVDVPSPNAWQRVEFFFGRMWRGVFG